MRDRIFHPFLFAVYPILALLAYNIEEIKAQDALRSLVVSLVVVWAVYFLISRWLREPPKAALITTFSLFLFYTYGQVYNLFKTASLLEITLGRHRMLLPIWIVLWIVGVWLILRRKGPWTSLTRALNLIGVILLVFPLGQLGLYAVRSMTVSNSEQSKLAAESVLQLPADQPAPDIYYIILDAYARDDVLRKQFNLENQPFLHQLEELGFYVARCSQSNYAQTRLSLASSLNMDYLSELGDSYKPGNNSRVGITELVHHGRVRQLLEQLGYTSIAFETGFKGTQWEDADFYLSPAGDSLGFTRLWGGLTSFEEMLIRTSAGLVLVDSKSAAPNVLQSNLNNPKRVNYDLITFALATLRTMPSRTGP